MSRYKYFQKLVHITEVKRRSESTSYYSVLSYDAMVKICPVVTPFQFQTGRSFV